MLVTKRYYNDDGFPAATGVFTYFRNRGGRGDAAYEVVASHNDVVRGEVRGTTFLRGGNFYAAETIVPYAATIDLRLPDDFHAQESAPAIFSWTDYELEVQFHRQASALLTIQSNDPETWVPDGPIPVIPSGSHVPLLGEGLADGEPGPAPPPGAADRWFGPDRFATAAAVSAALFPPGVDVAFVATGANFPDALAGGPAGGLLGGPILLTRRDSLPEPTSTELQRLNPARVVVLGGPAVVSDAVANQLAAYTTGAVTRWSGPDRYATAAAVSAATFPDGADVAFIATGANFPDALAGGPAGGIQQGPILLTGRDTLPQATSTELQRLNTARIVLLGGPGAVSDAVANQLQAYLP